MSRNDLSTTLFYSVVERTFNKSTGTYTLILRYPLHNAHSEHLTSKFLKLEIILRSADVIQFIFKDANETRFELPYVEPFPYHKEYNNFTNLNFADYELILNEHPFFFAVMRKKTNEMIFSTMNTPIIFKKNYCEISTIVPTENLFGLGERTMSFKVKSGIYTFYNKDLPGVLEDGSGRAKNRYGSHPMYLMREKSSNYHISYLRNSFPMDIIVSYGRELERGMITYKIAGGVIDFTLFLGDKNPENVIKKYHSFLGGYSIPPFWAMGFHQSRWGYEDIGKIRDVLVKYELHGIPLDTIWLDIDYMIDQQPFTWDEDRYNSEEFRKLMAIYKKKFVPISETCIGTKMKEMKLYLRGKENGIFIKNSQGNDLLNHVWPGKVHFIDYFNPQAKPYWEEAHIALYTITKFSGLWLDMNEIATFSDGQVNTNDEQISCTDKKGFFPYIPGNTPLEKSTICPNAVHYHNYTHIEVHNYYSVQQVMLTYQFLENLFPDEFPFILTRANAPGTGKFSAHWSGDNVGTFDWYKLSISEVFNNNLFGIPMIGSDICGFSGNTEEKLCAKWYQMGSLFPFSRSHNHKNYQGKEPFSKGNLLLNTSKKSIKFRYSILKYYYYLFLRNKGIGTIFRPVFFEFYQDEVAIKNEVIDRQFMIGSDLMAVPDLNNDLISNATSAYFPEGDWYDLRNYHRVQFNSTSSANVSTSANASANVSTSVNASANASSSVNASASASSDRRVTISTELNEMPAVFLRSGRTIFTNKIEDVKNSFDLSNVFVLVIALENSDKRKLQLVSRGHIPALMNYHSRSRVEECMGKQSQGKDCFIEVTTTYDILKKTLSLRFSQAHFYSNDYTYISINHLVVLLPIDNVIINLAVENTNLTEFIEKPENLVGEAFVITRCNSNCVDMTIKGELKLKKEESLNVFIHFK